MIQPTVGRKVWFYAGIAAAMDPNVQPQDATVVYVISDRLVNLRVSDHKGDQTPKLAVQLYQEGDEDPKGEFACWMPYQSQQAKRNSEAEKASIQSGFDVLAKRLDQLEKEVQSLQVQKVAQVPSPPAHAGDPPDKQVAAGSGSSANLSTSTAASVAAKQVTK